MAAWRMSLLGRELFQRLPVGFQKVPEADLGVAVALGPCAVELFFELRPFPVQPFGVLRGFPGGCRRLSW